MSVNSQFNIIPNKQIPELNNYNIINVQQSAIHIALEYLI